MSQTGAPITSEGSQEVHNCLALQGLEDLRGDVALETCAEFQYLRLLPNHVGSALRQVVLGYC